MHILLIFCVVSESIFSQCSGDIIKEQGKYKANPGFDGTMSDKFCSHCRYCCFNRIVNLNFTN